MIDRAAAEALAVARLSPGRVEHSRRVAAEAVILALRHGADAEAAAIAGLLHDYCRELPPDAVVAAAHRHGITVGPLEARRPVGLLHGPVAAAQLAEAGLQPEAAAAIARHTVGGPGMTVLEKCLYVADFCEPGRGSAGLDRLREVALRSLDEAAGEAVRVVLLGLIARRRGVVPEALALYNETHGVT